MRGNLRLLFNDKSRNEAKHSVSLEVEASTSVAGLSSIAEVWANLYLTLSDARIKQWSFEFDSWYPLGATPKGPASVYRRAVFLSLAINNGLATLEIPAVKAELMDSSGRFAGIRVRDQIATVNALSAAFHSGGRRLFDDGNNEFIPSSFIVGGRTS